MKAKVRVTLKEGVLDPQGKAVSGALQSLGFEGIMDVRQGKYIEIDLSDVNRDEATEKVESMCKDLLVNLVIENYDIQIEE